MINKILFDLDNVIVDSADWHYKGVNAALKRLYNYEIPYKDHLKQYNGLPTRIKVAKLIEAGKLPANADLKVINTLKQNFTISIINEECHPDPEKLKIMNNLACQGWTIGCVTNSIRLTAELMLNRSGLLQFMSVLVCGDEVKKGKPDPESYIKAMNKLKAGMNEVVVVEDSEYGIQSAREAGCKVIQVSHYNDVTWKNIIREIEKMK